MNLSHRYRKAKNRLLKFCYVPATNAAQNRLLFFAAAVYSTNEANKAGLKPSILLDVYDTNIYSYLETSGGRSSNLN